MNEGRRNNNENKRTISTTRKTRKMDKRWSRANTTKRVGNRRSSNNDNAPKKANNNAIKTVIMKFVSLGVLGICLVRSLSIDRTQSQAGTKNEHERVREELLKKPLVFTDHGACRMDCRCVSKRDVIEALDKGKYRAKYSSERKRTHAFEHGRVRVIFAQSSDNKTTAVVTVIDTETDHACGPC
jgi:hypothetical protein